MANATNKNDNQRAREIEDAKREFRERAQKVKDLSIVDYLHTIGYKETHVNGRKKEHYYFDLTNSNKKTGETHVDSDLNKFFVFDGTRSRGDIIDLVQMLDNCNYVEAVNKLSGSSASISTVKTSSVKKTASAETKDTSNVTTLSDDSKISVLVDYAKRRYISTDTIKRSEILFLSQEIVKDNETKHFFFLGLKNDSQGYSIRNKAMKGMRGTMDITTIEKQPGQPFVVVEGMFEYLSILEATKNFDLNFIILNSTVNAQKAAEKINTHSVTTGNPDALILLNNDKPGQDAAKEILAGCTTKNLVNDFPKRGEDLNFTLKLDEGIAEISGLINRVFIQLETGVAANNSILSNNNAKTMDNPLIITKENAEQFSSITECKDLIISSDVEFVAPFLKEANNISIYGFLKAPELIKANEIALENSAVFIGNNLELTNKITLYEASHFNANSLIVVNVIFMDKDSSLKAENLRHVNLLETRKAELYAPFLESDNVVFNYQLNNGYSRYTNEQERSIQDYYSEHISKEMEEIKRLENGDITQDDLDNGIVLGNKEITGEIPGEPNFDEKIEILSEYNHPIDHLNDSRNSNQIEQETGVAANNPLLITNNANKMTTQNTAAEQQPEQSQTMKNMEFAMKMLGLLPQWEKVKQQFQTWTDDPHTQGKKSFTVNDASFKRTGNYQKPESTEQAISTDMVADLSLNFNKRDDKVYFNSYTATLKNSIANSISKPVTKSNTYDVFLKKDEMVNNVTVKEGLNLLDGRSVKIENNTWAKMILDETAYDAKTGKHVINEYEFDLQRAIDNNKNIDLSKTPAEQLEKAIKLLEKGDYAFVNAVIDDKPVVVFLAADAQYKQVTAHNQNLYEHLTAAQKTEIAQRIENKQNQSQDQNAEQKTGISR